MSEGCLWTFKFMDVRAFFKEIGLRGIDSQGRRWNANWGGVYSDI